MPMYGSTEQHTDKQNNKKYLQITVKLDGAGYSTLHSQPRLNVAHMSRRTHTQRDAKRHNTFTR